MRIKLPVRCYIRAIYDIVHQFTQWESVHAVPEMKDLAQRRYTGILTHSLPYHKNIMQDGLVILFSTIFSSELITFDIGNNTTCGTKTPWLRTLSLEGKV